MSVDVVLTIIGLITGLGFQTWAIVKFILAKIESQEAKSNDEVTALHERINGVKDDYVKRVDLDRDLGTLKDLIVSIKVDTHKALADIKSDQHQMMAQINARLDSLNSTISERGRDSDRH